MARVYEGENRLKKIVEDYKQQIKKEIIAGILIFVFWVISFSIAGNNDFNTASLILFIPAMIAFAAFVAYLTFFRFEGASYVSGLEGEQKALEILSSNLDNDHIILNSIDVEWDGQNIQIDNIIIGPTGVYIIEVKNHNSALSGRYDDRHFVQHKEGIYQNYDVPVKNFCKQASWQVYNASRYLKNNGISTYINAAIFFTNIGADPLNIVTDKIPVFRYRDRQKLIEYIRFGKQRLGKQTRERICGVLMDANGIIQQ